MINGNVSRRDWLTWSVATALSATSSLSLAKDEVKTLKDMNSDDNFWNAPRELWLKHVTTKEQLKIVYHKDGQLDQGGYNRVCALLRDIHINQAVNMDPRLLDLMRAIQGYLSFFGFNQPILIHSGYRSAKTNKNTEGAAKNSMHLYGKAIDFHMDGIPSDYLGKLAAYYRGGGVGFYTGREMSHIDTGLVRYWRH